LKTILAALVLGWAFQAAADERREWPKTDFSRRTVELAENESGGPPKDGIPAIDRPSFVGALALGMKGAQHARRKPQRRLGAERKERLGSFPATGPALTRYRSAEAPRPYAAGATSP
jgi:hypothetical protein